MSRKQKANPSTDFAESVEKKAATVEAGAEMAEEPSSAASTTRYDTPAPAAPRLEAIDVPAAAAGVLPPWAVPWDMQPRAFPLVPVQSQARLLASRALAQAEINKFPEAQRPYLMARVNERTGAWYITSKPLAIDSDPLVQEVGTRLAAVKAKIDAIHPTLSFKQAVTIQKMWRRATIISKGKHENEARKVPNVKALEKVLFRALEFHASRRAAQLAAQARNARAQRHSLQQHSKPVALPDGRTIGTNKRWLKKIASKAIIRDGTQAAKAAAAQERARHTAVNKARRVQVAVSHNRKVNKKDLPAGTSVAERPQFASLAQIGAMPGAQVMQ
jgi:hypothetical protein